MPNTVADVEELEATVVALLGLSEERLEEHFLSHFVDAKIRDRMRERFELLRGTSESGRYTYVDETLHRTIGFATMNGHFPLTGSSGSIRPIDKRESGALGEYFVDMAVHIRFDLLLLRRALAEAHEVLDEREVSVEEQATLKEDRRVLRRGTPRRVARPDAPLEDEVKHLRIHDQHRFAKERRTHIGRFTFRQYRYCPRFLAKCALLLFRQVCPSPARLDALRGNRELADGDAVELRFTVEPDTRRLEQPWVSDGGRWVGYAQLEGTDLVLSHPSKQVSDSPAQHIFETSAYKADIDALMGQIDRLVRRAFSVALTFTSSGHRLTRMSTRKQHERSTFFRRIRSTLRLDQSRDEPENEMHVDGRVYIVRDVGGSLAAALRAIAPTFRQGDATDDEDMLSRFSRGAPVCVLVREDEDVLDEDGTVHVHTAVHLGACYERGMKRHEHECDLSRCENMVMRRTEWSDRPYYDALIRSGRAGRRDETDALRAPVTPEASEPEEPSASEAREPEEPPASEASEPEEQLDQFELELEQELSKDSELELEQELSKDSAGQQQQSGRWGIVFHPSVLGMLDGELQQGQQHVTVPSTPQSTPGGADSGPELQGQHQQGQRGTDFLPSVLDALDDELQQGMAAEDLFSSTP